MRFEYFEPSSVPEAQDLLRRGDGGYRVLAGGTDILLQIRRRVKNYRGLVNIKRLPGMSAWSADAGGGLRLGAAVPMRELEKASLVIRRFPALFESLNVIGSIQLRNIATIGGNLCNASPAADTAPSLIVAGAIATFVDNGSDPGTIPVEEFFSGPGRSVLGAGGLLLGIDLPAPQGMTGESFERLTPRSAMDIAIVSAASRVTLDPSTGRIVDAAIALGAVAPTPVRAAGAEKLVRGHPPTPELLAEAGRAAMEECRPIDDIRGTAAYRRAMVAVLVRRTLERAIERARRGGKSLGEARRHTGGQ